MTMGQVDFDKKDNLKEALLLRKRHQHERKNDVRTRDRLPLIRSLADIGRNSSKGLFGSHSKFKLVNFVAFPFLPRRDTRVSIVPCVWNPSDPILVSF